MSVEGADEAAPAWPVRAVKARVAARAAPPATMARRASRRPPRAVLRNILDPFRPPNAYGATVHHMVTGAESAVTLILTAINKVGQVFDASHGFVANISNRRTGAR